jgi:hypothetical protein
MNSFAFDRLDEVALEQTLAYFEAYPEPQDHDLSYVEMFNDAIAEGDWMEMPGQLHGGGESQSR